MALVGLVTVMPASAQSYRNSRYYNRNTGRLDYSQRNHSRYGNYSSNPFYIGFRVGPSFSSVSSDNDFLDGSSTKTGLNVGVAAGFGVSPYVPLFFESGLYYTEKGGKGKANVFANAIRHDHRSKNPTTRWSDIIKLK